MVAPATTDVDAGLHVKLNGPEPDATAVAEPLFAPKQVTVNGVTATVGPAGLDKVVANVVVQPAPS